MIWWIMAIIQPADILPLYAPHSQRSETQEGRTPPPPKKIHRSTGHPLCRPVIPGLEDSNPLWVIDFLRSRLLLCPLISSRLISYYLEIYLLFQILSSCLIRSHLLLTWSLALSVHASNPVPSSLVNLIVLYLLSSNIQSPPIPSILRSCCLVWSWTLLSFHNLSNLILLVRHSFYSSNKGEIWSRVISCLHPLIACLLSSHFRLILPCFVLNHVVLFCLVLFKYWPRFLVSFSCLVSSQFMPSYLVSSLFFSSRIISCHLSCPSMLHLISSRLPPCRPFMPRVPFLNSWAHLQPAVLASSHLVPSFSPVCPSFIFSCLRSSCLLLSHFSICGFQCHFMELYTMFLKIRFSNFFQGATAVLYQLHDHISISKFMFV